MLIYDAPRTDYRNDIGMLFESDEINLWRDMAIWLDQASFRTRAAFSYHHVEPGVAYQASTNNKGDKRFAQYGVLMPQGGTTLDIGGRITRYGSETLDIVVNGVTAHTLSASGAWGRTVALGVPVGSVVQVDVIKRGTTSGWGSYDIDYCFISPVALVDAWPGLPGTFAGTYSAASFQQIARAIDWLFRRIAAVPMPLALGQRWRPCNYKVKSSTTSEPWAYTPIWSGSVLKTENSEVWQVGLEILNAANPTESWDLVLNGSVVVTLGPYTPNEAPYVSMSNVSLAGVTTGTRAAAAIRQRVTSGQTGESRVNTRVSLTTNHVTSLSYPVATPPIVFVPDADISAAVVDNRLNAIVTMLQTVYTRIINTSTVWSRSDAMRLRFAVDAVEQRKGKMQSWYPHLAAYRRGERLVVRGQRVALGSGVVSPSAPTDAEGEAPPNRNAATYQFSEAVVDDRAIATTETQLDRLVWLPESAAYAITGDTILYAGEYLR